MKAKVLLLESLEKEEENPLFVSGRLGNFFSIPVGTTFFMEEKP